EDISLELSRGKALVRIPGSHDPPSKGGPASFFFLKPSASFFRLRSSNQATNMQSSYSRYIGPPIINIETASGVGARNAAAIKIRTKAYARVRRKSATDRIPS